MKIENQKIKSLATVGIFCAMIGAFAPATFILPKKNFSETENRYLAELPALTAESVFSGAFESDFETYFSDHFAWRNSWVEMKTAAERLALKSESKDIYFGKDGYFIEKHSGAFTSDTARRNVAYLLQFEAKYKAQFGERFSVMIVPNAADILREKLPPFAAPHGGEQYLAQIKNALSENSFFDAASILKAHDGEALYYKTDHHWRTLAAFYAYQAWTARQGFSVPQKSDFDIVAASDDFQGTIQSKLGIKTDGDTIELFLPKNAVSYSVQKDDKDNAEADVDLYYYPALETKDKYAVFFGGNFAQVRITTENKNGRKSLVIKDSYANCFVPFMLGEFEQIDMLDLRYTNQRLSQIIERGGYTDMLLLHNATGFAEDRSIAKLVQ